MQSIYNKSDGHRPVYCKSQILLKHLQKIVVEKKSKDSHNSIGEVDNDNVQSRNISL